MNRLQLSATLLERSALRYTPAGIPVVEAQLQHCSQTVEAGMERRLEFPLDVIAIGEPAKQLAGEALGEHLQLSGFLAPRSRRSTRLMVHVQEFTRCAPPGAPGAAAMTEEN